MVSIKVFMSNKIVQRCTAVAIGAAVSAGTYLLAGLVERKIREKQEDEETDAYEEHEYTTYPDIPEGVNQLEPMEVDDEPEFLGDRTISAKYEKPDIVDYTRYSKLVEEIISKNDEKVEEAAEEKEEENPACSFITEKEYLDTVGGFAKADATYFTVDKILAGWNEDLVIRDIPSTVGWKAIHAFDDPSVKSVYVRNSELEVDYEIVRCDDLFDEVVQEAIASEE